MNDREKLKNAMTILRSLGYTSRISLPQANVDTFIQGIKKTRKGVFVVGHDLDETYDMEGNLIRRIYLSWICTEPDEILSVCYEQGLNVYWNGRAGYAIEIWPRNEEVPEMYF